MLRTNTLILARQVISFKSSEKWEGYDDSYSTHHMAALSAWRRATNAIRSGKFCQGTKFKPRDIVKLMVGETIEAVDPIDFEDTESDLHKNYSRR